MNSLLPTLDPLVEEARRNDSEPIRPSRARAGWVGDWVGYPLPSQAPAHARAGGRVTYVRAS